MNNNIKLQAEGWIHANPALQQHPNTLHILYSICHNISTHPSEGKFRSIRLDNQKFKEQVLDVDGAVDLLYLVGFEMDKTTNCLVLRGEGVGELEEMCQVLDRAEHATTSVTPPHVNSTQSRVTPPITAHHDLFTHHEPQLHHPPVSSPPKPMNIEDIEKQRELEERKKQLAEEKRLKREEAQRLKNLAKLDRQEKHDEDVLHPPSLTHAQHHPAASGASGEHNPFYSGMTTYKDLGMN